MTEQQGISEDDFADFFAGGAGGAPSFHFAKKINNGVIGTIVKMEKVQQTKEGDHDEKLWFDKDKTQPRMQLNVTLQTDLRNWEGCNPDRLPKDADGNAKPTSEDDGTRRIYLKFKSQQAVGKALQDAGVKGPQLGGKLGLKLTDISPNPNGSGTVHDYAAVYEAPSGAEGFDFGGDKATTEEPAKAADPVKDEPPF